jgi:hypothetical protein
MTHGELYAGEWVEDKEHVNPFDGLKAVIQKPFNSEPDWHWDKVSWARAYKDGKINILP